MRSTGWAASDIGALADAARKTANRGGRARRIDASSRNQLTGNFEIDGNFKSSDRAIERMTRIGRIASSQTPIIPPEKNSRADRSTVTVLAAQHLSTSIRIQTFGIRARSRWRLGAIRVIRVIRLIRSIVLPAVAVGHLADAGPTVHYPEYLHSEYLHSEYLPGWLVASDAIHLS
jgi:hypothetical protein